jgi:hypothetical protein
LALHGAAYLENRHGHARASGSDRTTGLLEVAEAIQRLVEATLKVGLVPLDSVQVGLIGNGAGAPGRRGSGA